MRAPVFFVIFFNLIFLVGCSQKTNLPSSIGTSASIECGEMDQTECDMAVAINAERAKAGMPSLKINSTCVRMARDHVEDMIARHFFSHDSPTETFRQRVTRYGLAGGWVGENIAQSPSIQGAVTQWMNSAGHKANILNSNYRATGVGYSQGLWVQCFTSLTD